MSDILEEGSTAGVPAFSILGNHQSKNTNKEWEPQLPEKVSYELSRISQPGTGCAGQILQGAAVQMRKLDAHVKSEHKPHS